MKLAIMQPYLMPYLGYWQLIAAVDTFIFYDDVNFIKRGYVNRNQLLINEAASTFTVPLIKASQNKLISEIDVSYNEDWVTKLLRKIEFSYKKAPFFNEVFTIFEKELMEKPQKISELNISLLKAFSDYLELNTNFKKSSKLGIGLDKKAQYRILEMCQKLDADTYINPIGGQAIYDRELFAGNDIELFFIKMEAVEYSQFENEFVPNLSMLDVLLFNDKELINKLLNQYKLI